MVKAQKYIVTKFFEGAPQQSDYEIVEYELPPLKDGEILVKVEWISVDPYLRSLNRDVFGKPLRGDGLPYDQFSFNIGTILESNNSNYPVGTKVVSHEGWCDYYITNPNAEHTNFLLGTALYKLPDLSGLPISLGVGAVGMPGATAYFGFLEICKPKPGETVVVTGAAGAVGSLVGQIAKIKGCKVIGFAGSDEKVQWLEQELGFDKAFNYKTVDISAALKEAAPDGVDCYFDNVGGKISSLIMDQMNDYGRIAVCGIISAYNEDPNTTPMAPIVQPAFVIRQLKMEGVIVYRWRERWQEAFAEIISWIESGQLKAKEHVTEGFDKLFDAFAGMLAGENFGKAVVKL